MAMRVIVVGAGEVGSYVAELLTRHGNDVAVIETDRDRLRLIAEFAEAGHADQILISHDICTKTRLRHWGGHGYGHILRNIVPMMRRFGFEAGLIDKLLRETPLRLLTLKETAA